MWSIYIDDNLIKRFSKQNFFYLGHRLASDGKVTMT